MKKKKQQTFPSRISHTELSRIQHPGRPKFMLFVGYGWTNQKLLQKLTTNWIKSTRFSDIVCSIQKKPNGTIWNVHLDGEPNEANEWKKVFIKMNFIGKFFEVECKSVKICLPTQSQHACGHIW